MKKIILLILAVAATVTACGPDANTVDARAEAEDFWDGLTPAFRGQLCVDIRGATEGFIRERFRNGYMDEQIEEHGFENTRDDLWDYAQKFGAAMAELVLKGCTTTEIRWPLTYCDNSMALPQFPWQGVLIEEYEDGTVNAVGDCSVTFDEDGYPDGYTVP